MNHTRVSTGEVNLKPLKGIFKCRCSRSMSIKNKKPAKGVSKLTYRCTCVETKNSPYFCPVARDEVSYDFTNTIITNLFK